MFRDHKPNIYFFPAAGLGPTAYGDMTRRLTDVNLSPSMCDRLNEESLKTHIERVANKVQKESRQKATASLFVAESMGGIIAAAVASTLIEKGHAQTLELLMFGTGSPQDVMKHLPRVNEHGTTGLIRFAVAVGGLPPWVERSPKLAESLLRPLRRDIARLAEFDTRMIDSASQLPMTHVRGTKDPLVTRADATDWVTACPDCRRIAIPGTHLLLAHNADKNALEIISDHARELHR